MGVPSTEEQLDDLCDTVEVERAGRIAVALDATVATALLAAAVFAPRPVLSAGIGVWLCAVVWAQPGPATATVRAALVSDPSTAVRLRARGVRAVQLVRSLVAARAVGCITAALVALGVARVDHRAAGWLVCSYASLRWSQLVWRHTRARAASRVLDALTAEGWVAAWRTRRARRSADATEFLAS